MAVAITSRFTIGAPTPYLQGIQGGIAFHGVSFSGSYVTNGDLADFFSVSPFGEAFNPVQVYITGKAGWQYNYDLINKKILIRGQQPTSATAGVIPFDELAAGAYPGSIIGDNITAMVFYGGFAL